MLKKRIIPCLDIKDGRTVKGVNFTELRDAGDPVELAKRYVQEGADELVFLDITATVEKRKTLTELIERIAREINIPFTVGGGINSLEDAKAVINAGADKVSINSSAVKNPELITQIAQEFGNQCVVVAIDFKSDEGGDFVYVKGGSEKTNLKLLDWAKEVVLLGAGEILLTSMNHDGTKNGFSLEQVALLSSELSIPVIASGGAGKTEHFIELFQQTQASAGLAASIFHFEEITIGDLKQELSNHKIQVRCL
ncbi:MAG: imidazole glycerol phosphate synthase subunit HisF [Flavobacteriia bacterium]|nr:imidazole glycerol phosphate synthase subunit HisF [Flavobacteriia bacterium]OJX37663.1 MAG: imidazole glycerol phosphate synthase subunit HisF [Flavobacteriia bacterium 40-80]